MNTRPRLTAFAGLFVLISSLLTGSGTASAADDCGTEVWRMTIKKIVILNNGDYAPDEEVDYGGDLYGSVAFDGQYVWSGSYDNAADNKVRNGEELRPRPGEEWKLWNEKLIPTDSHDDGGYFTVEASVRDRDHSGADEDVAVGTEYVYPRLAGGEGTHFLDYCHGSDCYYGHTRITFELEKVGECEECSAL
ncbi:hypothetical protein [Streptomyces sp. ISL-11]|uniref:hypothetical protein n=1 Tax=Streptomyces sp. ISL-11 TaxID=2819174 RepID=UPI001BE9725B|nr:hypothetical protein [Streptomyces sp. ISL-11]MBT2383622.1 hypothetical protein [Streptomyces sp. ISL-11]